MRALLLGSGASDIQAPYQCECENCRTVRQRDGRSLRTYTSLLLDNELLVDCGGTVPEQMKKFAPTARVKQVFITHADRDHLNSVALARVPADAARLGLPIYGSSAVTSLVRYEIQRHVTLHPMSPLKPTAAGDWTALPLPARHRGQPGDSLIYVFSRQGKSLLYACDTGPLPEETVEALAGMTLDAVVAEATFGHAGEHPDLPSAHMNFPLVCEMRQDFLRRGIIGDSTPFIAAHVSLHFCPPHEESAQWLRERGVALAFDGMQFDL
ncbi:MAG: hypothetical protein GXP25_23700 [Planctomycetes bacterium]|nr:hypothetical protein [Planctomycetota bacterium]